jgi:hypothetical protein
MSDGDLEPATASYELFATDPCAATVPLGDLVDRFHYARFAPLIVVRDDGKEPAVIPTDYVLPETYNFLGRYLAEHNVPNNRGGVPLFETWQEVNPDAATKPVEVVVDNMADFLAKPGYALDGREVALSLQPEAVRNLLRGVATTIATETGMPVTVRPNVGVRRSTVPMTPVLIEDLPAFLSRPEVQLNDGTSLSVTLSETNVRELTEIGTTRLALDSQGNDSPGDDLSVNVTVCPNDATHSTPSGLTALGGGASGVIHSVDDRAGLIHQIAPPPIDLSLPAFQFALFLPYRQEWQLLGYSRGTLLNSIPLVPHEETTIEIRAWDRFTSSAELLTTDESEATLEGTISRKETTDVVGELSRTNDWRTTAGGQIGLPPIEGVTVAGQFTNDLGETVGKLNRSTLNTIDEAIYKASATLRASRQSKVSETHEWGSETRVTRHLTNANDCRVVTYDFFELLATYDVATRPVLDEMRLAVLVADPFPEKIDRPFVLAHEGVLRDALLDSRLESGFDAARELAASELYCSYHCAPNCECDKSSAALAQPPVQPVGSGQGHVSSGSPQVTDQVKAAEDEVRKVEAAVRESIETLKSATHRVASVVDTGGTKDQIEEAVLEYRQWLFRQFGLEKFAPGFWSSCLAYTRDPSFTPERLERFLASIAGSWVETLIRGTFVAGLAVAAAAYLAAELVTHLGTKTLWYGQFFGFHDAGLGASLDQARAQVKAWRDLLDAKIATGPSGGGPGTGTDGGPPSNATVPPQITAITGTATPRPWPPEQLSADEVAETALLSHIRLNRGHYEAAIWSAMDPVDRARLIGIYDRLSTLVENDVLGFVGDKIALPYSLRMMPGLEEAFADTVAELAREPLPPSRKITVPTRGIHVQPRVGDCDVCEPAALRRQELELDARKAQVDRDVALVEQAELETERYRVRLQTQPPLLDDPEGP